MSNAHGYDPTSEIEAGNPWYVADQAEVQMMHPAYRAVIESRWKHFDGAVAEWVAQTGTTSATVLDAGCGDGINLSGLERIVSRHLSDCRIVGLDYNPVRLKRAQDHDPSLLIQSSLLDLPLRKDAFRLILFNQVLEHILQPGRALQQIYGAMAPNGLLILSVPNEGCSLAWIRNRVLQPSIVSRTDHVNFFTGRSLRTLLERSGFRVMRIHREGFFWPHLRLHTTLGRTQIGRHWANTLRTSFPSQASELIALCSK